MLKTIKRLIRKIYPTTKLEMDAVFRNQEFLKRSFINTTPMPLIHFSIHLTEHCNLNCKGCSHFCNLHKYRGDSAFQKHSQDPWGQHTFWT